MKNIEEPQTTPREELGRWIARVNRRRFQLCEMMLTKMGIGPGQVPILTELAHHGELTQRELAEHTHVTPATISGTLKRMERAGLISRTDDKKDARVSIVTLTDAGNEVAREARELFACADEKMLEGFDDIECQVICECLMKMRDNLMQAIEKAGE